ncbi:hypothetical protein VE01_07441 [Pseudogymnoascus verrucosus]|uniref:Transmembrane protein n=1 Tax=Pseudogymnoascus verrucosus TaxID=342668 RepID=A0A1B8GGN0_9PEZI|nr:uncharacterized protein VE01_07441 [Pseudogymnoascus verrucosus]OBT94981.1 hypothetical protein VE01_07441 [Pseudogymnoascus verrucosus]
MAPLPHPSTNDITPIPTTYSSLNGPPPGQIAGIVLGSVFGFILIAYLLYTTCSGSAVLISDAETVSEVEVRRRKRRGSRSSRGTPVVERIVVQERTERRMGSGRSQRSRSVGSVEEVVVIEEGSPPPRRSRSQRGGGYREVDPREFGGGGRPMREVRRERR